jgi:preprotein translocase subunit SecA
MDQFHEFLISYTVRSHKSLFDNREYTQDELKELSKEVKKIHNIITDVFQSEEFKQREEEIAELKRLKQEYECSLKDPLKKKYREDNPELVELFLRTHQIGFHDISCIYHSLADELGPECAYEIMRDGFIPCYHKNDPKRLKQLEYIAKGKSLEDYMQSLSLKEL